MQKEIKKANIKIEKVNNRNKINLRTEFLSFTLISMLIIVAVNALLINNIIVESNNSFKMQSIVAQKKVMNSILETTMVSKIASFDTHEFKTLFKFLVSNNASMLILVDANTHKVVFSNNEKLINIPFNQYSVHEFLLAHGITDYIGANVLFDSNSKYNLYFIPAETNLANIEKIYMQMKIILVLSLVFALIVSIVLAQKVIGPLNSLIAGTKRFANGDFSTNIEESNYIEINNLVIAYNKMSDDLQALYSSLEQKVKIRTKELEVALNELKNTQSMMVHSEKMKSLGSLVAGITHEINNPINFIYGNLIHLSNYTNDLINIISAYENIEDKISPELIENIVKMKKDIDYAFLKSDLTDLINSCKEGTERTRNIVQDLKNFSRLDANVINTVDLEKEIDTTLNILTNKLKNRITVHKEYAESMPTIEAHGGQLNQVFMNILDNAAYAIKDTGDIYIRLNYDEKYALIEFEDTGSGMDADTIKHIFEPFYTTKPVGQGTGLGMSISYKVIKNHSGIVSLKSELGKGSLFTIKIPREYTSNEEIV